MIRKNAQGFSIPELIVAMFVAAIYFMAISSATTSYTHTGTSMKQLTLSNSYVEGKVESLRNVGYNGLTVGTSNISSELPSGLPAPRNAQLTISSPSGGIKQVDISVTYNDSGINRNYSYTTYIGELGVGQ